eukprot:COSAG06_NODE_3927_length_4747_cov_2.122182_5_plen_102_part_01
MESQTKTNRAQSQTQTQTQSKSSAAEYRVQSANIYRQSNLKNVLLLAAAQVKAHREGELVGAQPRDANHTKLPALGPSVHNLNFERLHLAQQNLAQVVRQTA